MAPLAAEQTLEVLVSMLQEARAATFHTRDEGVCPETASAAEERQRMQDAGYRLQDAYVSLQYKLRKAVGDAVEWGIVNHEHEAKTTIQIQNKECFGEWTSLRTDAQVKALEAALAEATQWRQLAESRGEQLLHLKEHLSAMESRIDAKPREAASGKCGMIQVTNARCEAVKRVLRPGFEVPSLACAFALQARCRDDLASDTQFYYIGTPMAHGLTSRSVASDTKSARERRLYMCAQA
eukprot:TRINITY_DN6716_c0_g1_i1.p1 TRINITY_DN6716_c0_g1~~TRINITY_DN6716_c0_g1_i1.p1  ORF type:complete len:247 (-),score=49.95 TRINITY_DN6716_c0_g1_i1:186-899(-)